MGQNTGEFIFLTLMLSGVQAIGVSWSSCYLYRCKADTVLLAVR